MNLKDAQRKIQFRRGSYVVTIPPKIIHTLGIQINQYVRFGVTDGKIIIKPVETRMTKKDLADIDRYEKAFDEAMERIRKKAQKEPKGESM